LSGLQLFDPDLIPLLDELLCLHSLSGEFLKLEITESVLMENAEAAVKVLEQLKQRNILLSLDDFGTGYSNLMYLQRLPIDTLKIDRSFVTGIEEDGKNLALVEATVNLARALGLETIAEGVETNQQQILLFSLGCQYGQGYFFSKPLEPEDVVVLLRSFPDYSGLPDEDC
jgi:EAL domain-containing protein (putative c-di-GMP-specific phosphodiesterase class I)